MEISETADPFEGPIVSTQEWRDVAFLHWRVPAALIAPHLPAGVVPDEYDGSAWVGLIAFELRNARVAPLLTGPGLTSFTEVNVRTYAVDARGRRGVVFLSLEAGNLAFVLGARATVGLPYFWAKAGQRTWADGWEYASLRRSPGGAKRRPDFRLKLAVDAQTTAHDELSTFLTARWGLFQSRFGRTHWMPNAHEPWVLHPASVVTLRDELGAAAGLGAFAQRAPDSVLFSPGVHTRFGLPQRLTGGEGQA